jgi:DNA-binding NtrC family response regulator
VLEDQLAGDERGALKLLGELRPAYPDLPIVVLLAERNLDQGSELLSAGATDLLVRRRNLTELVTTQLKKINHLIEVIEKNRRLEQRYAYLRDVERSRYLMVGNSPQIQEVYTKINKVAGVPRPVLITGERGTGKELVARAIHDEAQQSQDQPWVVINCAAFSDELLDSELFGHEAGAFTGATRRHSGKFEQAHNGTLFLDEIGNMSLYFQQKIMRVVEYGTLRRVGGDRQIRVNVRVIAATNADLKKMMDEGKFLRDLYDRLSFEEIRLPALRERQGDVEVLARFFLHKFMEEIPDFQGKRFSEAAMAHLAKYHYPGNVRELKNIVERAVYRDTTNQITPRDLGLETSPQDLVPGTTFKEKTEAFEIGLIKTALDDCDGNQAAAARQLGLSYHQLRHHLKKYGDRIAACQTLD